MNQFLPTKNRTRPRSNEIIERNRYNLSLNGQKMLFGLAQSIDHTISLFPELGIDINGLFKFLDIEHRNDRYTVVRDALFNITENPLQIKAGEKKWSSIPWMSVEFDGDESSFVKISFHEKAKPFLLQLKEYTKIKGLHIANLSSAYATWLYPVFKMIETKYHGKHEISIKRLKEFTFTDDPKEHPAYNVDKSANNKFLTRVIGIRSNLTTKEVAVLKSGPIAEINEKTDIVVSVLKIAKKGQKFDGIVFHVANKTEAEKKATKAGKKEYVNVIPSGEAGVIRTPLKEFHQAVNEYNKGAKANNDKELSLQEYCEMVGYFMKGDGFAYKKGSADEYNRKKREEKRSFKERSLFDVAEDIIENLKR